MTERVTITRWRDLETWAPLLDQGAIAPWPFEPLRNLVSQVQPAAYSPELDETVRFAGVRWYGAGLFVREERTGSSITGKCYPLQPGLLVYNRLFAWKQSFAVVGPEFEGVVVSNEFPQFEVDQSVARTRFLALVCASAKFAEVALMRSTGSTAVSRNRLREADFLDLEIPLPPLDEQDRIVAQHDADVAAAEAAHLRGELQASAAWSAFAGALVGEPDQDTRAGGLVSVVKFANLSRWDKPGGETGLEFLHPEVRLDEIAVVRLGVQVPRGTASRQAHGGTPYLASRNIRRGHVAVDGVRVMDVPQSVIDSLTLENQDLLFVEGSGSPSEVGRCAIWRDELPLCIHQNSVVRARIRDHAAALPAFVEAWFNSAPGNEYIREQATTTSGLYHIGSAKLSGAPVPLPDVSTQQQLVDELNTHRIEAGELLRSARALHANARLQLEVEVFGSPAAEHPDDVTEEDDEETEA